MYTFNMATSGIYGLYDIRTSECLYVGMSIDIEERYKKHITLLKANRHRRVEFSQWYNYKRNCERLELRILEEVEGSLLRKREKFWFNTLKPKFFGQSPTGESDYFAHNEETKKKISEALINRRKEIYCDLYQKLETIHEYCADENISKKEAARLLGISVRRLTRFLSIENIEFVHHRSFKKPRSSYARRPSILLDNIDSVIKYSQDMSISRVEAAKLLKVSLMTLRKFLEKEEIVFVYSRRIPMDRDDLYRYYHEEGLSIRDIALIYQTTDVTVLNRMREYNIERRGQAEATAISNRERFGALSQQVLAPDC